MLKKIISIVISIIISCNLASTIYANDEINYTINPVFQSARGFSEGLAAVKYEGKWGYINTSGKLVISFFYEDAGRFSEGLAKVKHNGKWGFIDKDGEVKIDFKYAGCDDFSGGIAKAYPKFDSSGAPIGIYLIDKDGKNISSFKEVKKFHFIQSFYSRENKKYGYKDENGNIVLKPIYDEAQYAFSDGVAKVKIDGKSYFIDEQGNIKFEDKRNAGMFYDGFASISDVDGSFGIINKRGEVIYEPIFKSLYLGNGFAVVQEKLIKYGYGKQWGVIKLDEKSNSLDTSKQVYAKREKKQLEKYLVKPSQYDWNYDYDKISYRDANGETGEIKCNVNLNEENVKVDLRPFRDDNNKSGYEDDNGNIVIPAQFENAYEFSSNGLAKVSLKDETGFAGRYGNTLYATINTSGKIVIPPQRNAGFAFNVKLGIVEMSHISGMTGLCTYEKVVPSNWALDEVVEACKLDIVPEYLKADYEKNITREELCELVALMLERKFDKSINNIASEKAQNIHNVEFKDTENLYIESIYKLGVVNGRSKDAFDPDANLTRQEAATIITNVLNKFKGNCSINKALVFSDADNIAEWAKEGVSTVYERGLMKGNDGWFFPESYITRQQAIITILRLFKYL